MSRLAFASMIVATFLLAGCGGGGGGAPNVSLNVTGPASVDVEIYEGQTVPSVVISGRIAGDVAALNGKTLYLIVEIADAFLYAGTPVISLHSDGLGGNVQLTGSVPPNGAKTYTGSMRLRACLDLACASQLNVTNGSVPYSVRVKAGLTAPVDTVALQTSFGSLPTPVVVPVTLPDGVVSWSVRPWPDVSFGSVRAAKADDGSNNVVFSVREMYLPNSSYEQVAIIEAIAPDGQALSKSITAHLTTSPSGLRYAFQTPALSFTVPFGTLTLGDWVGAGVLLPNNDRDRWQFIGIDYVWPPQADSYDLRNRWLDSYMPDEISTPRSEGLQYTADLRHWTCANALCLPLGHYTATIQYRYSPLGGTPVDVQYPVELDIVN